MNMTRSLSPAETKTSLACARPSPGPLRPAHTKTQLARPPATPSLPLSFAPTQPTAALGRASQSGFQSPCLLLAKMQVIVSRMGPPEGSKMS
jgi:hypothetical protein